MADQPPGSPADWGTLVNVVQSVWAALIGPSALAVWGAWRWIVGRRDSKQDKEREERTLVRSSLGARETAYMDRVEREAASLRAELDRERGRNSELEQQRDEAYDQARAWKVRCHDLKHDLAGARSTVNVQRVSAGKPEVAWPDETLPPLEGIVADNARRAAEKAGRLVVGAN